MDDRKNKRWSDSCTDISGDDDLHPMLPNQTTSMPRETYYQMMQCALAIQNDDTVPATIRNLILMMWTFIRHTAFPQLISPRELERQRSIVITGIAEFLGKPSVICKANKQAARAILDTLRVECPIVSVYRIGYRQRGKTRPLKIILPTTSFHREVLRKAALLRDIPDYENVYIRPALTRHQLKTDGRKRDICRFLNSKGHDVVVYCNAICTRTDPPIPVDLSKFRELTNFK